MVNVRSSVYGILTYRTDLLDVSRGCAVKYASEAVTKSELFTPDIITLLSVRGQIDPVN